VSLVISAKWECRSVTLGTSWESFTSARTSSSRKGATEPQALRATQEYVGSCDEDLLVVVDCHIQEGGVMDEDLTRRLLFLDSEEEWEEANAENEATPREPGRWKVGVGGAPRSIPPWEGPCPDCGRTLCSGGGIEFGEFEPGYFAIRYHWSTNCPAWKYRRWRLWNRHLGQGER